VFLRCREKSVWLTDFLNLEMDEKSTFLGRKFQTLITRLHSLQVSSINSGVTKPKFTKLLHDIEASFMLLMCTLI